MERSNAQLLAPRGNVLGSKHRSVGRSLVAVCFDLHAAGDSDEGFSAGDVGDVDEGVVEGGEDVRHCEQLLAVAQLWA